MTTKQNINRVDQFNALTKQDRDRVWAGGNITGIPLQCGYCDEPAAYSSVNGPSARVSCMDAQHIAYVESWGSQVQPEDVEYIVRALAADHRAHAERLAWEAEHLGPGGDYIALADGNRVVKADRYDPAVHGPAA